MTTAIDRYIRLEALGLWRESPDAAPREVVVSFGKATLVLGDLADRPLTHWALAGTEAIEQSDGSAVYATSPDRYETLTIRDREMIAAIAAVSRAHLRPPPTPPARRPSRIWIALPVLALAAAALFGPRLLVDAATRMVPPERAEDIGDSILLDLMTTAGPACTGPAGQAALATVASRLASGDPPRLRVLDLGGVPVAALPGRTLLLDRTMLARASAPETVAGWIAVGLARMPRAITGLMAGTGPFAAGRYLFTGSFTDAALDRAARTALAPPVPGEMSAAIEHLRSLDIDPAPFVASLPRGLEPERSGRAASPDAAEPLISDRDWIALHGICG